MIFTRLRLFRDGGFYGAQDDMYGTNFTLSALFLTVKNAA